MRTSRGRRISLALPTFAFFQLSAPPALGFPPYRSTDAETADPGTLEVRLGLVKVEYEDQDNAYSSPLLRANLGLPRHLELISEFEYGADESRFADGAAGFKWVPLIRFISVGVETLALLPVSSDQDGAGVESQLLATLRRGDVRMHVNAGGFYDPRQQDVERGWRASILTEVQKGRFRPGIEVFAKQVHGKRVGVQIGSGIIVDLGPLDVRTGLHVGLTPEAPDLTASLWVTRKWPLW